MVGLTALGHRGEKGEKELIAFDIERAFFRGHRFDFIGKAEGEHGACFFVFDVRFGKQTLVGFPDVRGVRGVQLFVDGGEEGLDCFIHRREG